MAIAVTATDVWSDGKRQHVIGTLVFSGNYATGGEAISWAVSKIKSSRSPLIVRIEGKTAYLYGYDKAAAKIPIFAPGGAELAAAAYPGGVTGDTVNFYAIFDQLR